MTLENFLSLVSCTILSPLENLFPDMILNLCFFFSIVLTEDLLPFLLLNLVGCVFFETACVCVCVCYYIVDLNLHI